MALTFHFNYITLYYMSILYITLNYITERFRSSTMFLMPHGDESNVVCVVGEKLNMNF